MTATLLQHRSVDPAVDLVAPAEGLIVRLPAEKPKPHSGVSAIDRMDGTLNYLKSKVETFNVSEEVAKAFGEHKIAEGSFRVGILVHAHAARAAVGVALAVVSTEHDAKRLQKVDAGLAALTGCGGAILLGIGAAGSGGVLAVAAIMQGIGCGKSLVEFISLAVSGENVFDRAGFRELGLSIEVVSFVGSILGLGAGTLQEAGKAVSFAKTFGSALGRGDVPAKIGGRLGLGADAAGVVLKGVKYVLTPESDENLALELASPMKVKRVLDEAGLRRSLCFFPWPIQQQSLLGSCAPWGLDRYDRGR